MRLNRSAVCIAAALALPVTVAAQSYQAQTGTLDVKIEITGTCKVNDAVLDFGSHPDLTSNRDAAEKIVVVCPTDTKYWVGLGQGLHWEASPGIRRMETGGQYIKYRLYSDNNYTTEWHENIGTTTIGHFIATGGQDVYPLVGRVRTVDQTTPIPSPGTYTDKVLIKVAY